MKESHSNFSVCDVGLVINPKWPYLGATPDGKVSCTCCGKGIVEIKCPYCHKESTIDNATQDKNFCLKKDSSGKIYLDHSHAYYFQVQTQLFLTDLEYCDFCVSNRTRWMIYILSALVQTHNFGPTVSVKLIISLLHVFFQSCLESGTLAQTEYMP